MPDNNNGAPIGTDATGYEVLTKAVGVLLDAYPGLSTLGLSRVPFEQLTENGITFSADNGALVMTERRSITDYVRQSCQYPFFVVIRLAAAREQKKLLVQIFLDSLGKWLCKEPTEYEKADYPTLSGGRKITRITRDNPYGVAPNPDGTQDWILPVTINYTNEFQL